jgi:hypothetical protein
MKNGMIMTPEEALQHFVEIAKDEGFDENTHRKFRRRINL